MNLAILQFAALAKAFRGDRTEVAAAADLGVVPNTFGAWTDGLSVPPNTRLPYLAGRFGVPEDELRAIVKRFRDERAKPPAEVPAADPAPVANG